MDPWITFWIGLLTGLLGGFIIGVIETIRYMIAAQKRRFEIYYKNWRNSE